MRLVIPPEDPDLDGVASAYAYAEFLKKQDDHATCAVFGELDDDTEKLFEELDEEVSDASYYLYSADEITLVSASSMDNVSRRIQQEKVTEIVDHTADALDDFSEAEAEIDEDFSTAAGIIADKFRSTDTEISQESATALHQAITSEEVNGEDQEVADWLEEKLE